jgi:site-specific recombinase XerD
MHLFRHNIASSLLNNGHESAIIMEVLGHKAPLAVDYYLESDYVQLKECGIDISRWPIRKEVLS